MFSRLAAPERVDATEDELIMAYDNAEAETIVSESKQAARKMYKKKAKWLPMLFKLYHSCKKIQ